MLYMTSTSIRLTQRVRWSHQETRDTAKMSTIGQLLSSNNSVIGDHTSGWTSLFQSVQPNIETFRNRNMHCSFLFWNRSSQYQSYTLTMSFWSFLKFPTLLRLWGYSLIQQGNCVTNIIQYPKELTSFSNISLAEKITCALKYPFDNVTLFAFVFYNFCLYFVIFSFLSLKMP